MTDDGRDILTALRARGLRLRLDVNGRIRVGPRGLVDDTDRAILREHRGAVLDALTNEESAGLIAGGRPADPAVSCGGRERL